MIKFSSCLLVLLMGCVVLEGPSADDPDPVLPPDLNDPAERLCTNTVEVNGSITNQPADRLAVGTWTFTATVGAGDCGAPQVPAQFQIETRYVCPATKDCSPGATGDNVGYFEYVTELVAPAMRNRIKFTNGASEAIIELFNVDGTEVLNLRAFPALGIVDGTGEFSRHTVSQWDEW